MAEREAAGSVEEQEVTEEVAVAEAAREPEPTPEPDGPAAGAEAEAAEPPQVQPEAAGPTAEPEPAGAAEAAPAEPEGVEPAGEAEAGPELDAAAELEPELAAELLAEPATGTESEPEPEPQAVAQSESAGDTADGLLSTESAEMEAVIEAVLFVASEPVARGRLLEIFGERERESAARALEAVLARYAGGEGRGVMAEEVAGGIRLVTRPELVGWLRRFFDVSGGSKLSMAALETLAIVAYRQPITGPEVQELRGVNSSGVLSTLLQRRLVRIAGRKEVVGKPFLYATTREFLVHFGLKNLKDLPPLEEFEETFGEAGMAAGPGGGQAAGPGEDREERILQEVAAMEEAQAGAEEAEPEAGRVPAAGARAGGDAPAEEPPPGEAGGRELPEAEVR